MLEANDPVLTLRVPRSCAVAALTLMRKMPIEQIEQPYQQLMEAMQEAEVRLVSEERERTYEAIARERAKK